MEDIKQQNKTLFPLFNLTPKYKYAKYLLQKIVDKVLTTEEVLPRTDADANVSQSL